MARTLVELDGGATVLDAAERIARSADDADVVLLVPGGAPLLRSAVFLEVLRAQAAPRRLSIVSADARARSLASAAHVPAYASVAALERRELDPTERLVPQRRAALARTVAPPGGRLSLRRALAVAGSLLLAGLVVLAVIVPEAVVVVAPEVEPLGPVELMVRAGAGGTVTPTPLSAPITATVTGRSSGFRVDEFRATGSVQLQNRTTSEIQIPRGTVFRTTDGVRFLTTVDETLPQSVIIPPGFNIVVGRVEIPIEADAAGPRGNVAAGRITVGPAPSRYEVTNPEPTSGGEVRPVLLVTLEDYDAAVERAPEALRAAAQEQLRA